MTGTEGPHNLKQVAQALGVHYMTAYRYVRTGRLAAERDRANWVVHPAALAAFRAEHHPSPSTDGPEGPGAVDRVERLRRRLVVGDEAGAWAVVEDALVAGWDVEAALVDLVAPAVGRTDDGDGLAAGHLAASTAQRTAAALTARFRRRGRHRGTVVVGAPGGEGHSLALALLTDLLRLRNLAVMELGVCVPPAAFVDAAARADRLLGVAVGVTAREHLPGARDVVLALRRDHPGVPVLLGGQAVQDPEVAELVGADGWAADLGGVGALVEAWVPRARSARAGRPGSPA